MAQWNVRTYHKKSVEEIERYYQSGGTGRVTVTNGFRWGEWIVETNDDNPPEFEFVDRGSRKEYINMLDCCENNIEEVELYSMDDGGCWYDVEIEGLEEDKEEEIRGFLDENSPYELEEREDEDWRQDDCEWWVWGPIEITNDVGYKRIICADENGNVIDFKEEE